MRHVTQQILILQIDMISFHPALIRDASALPLGSPRSSLCVTVVSDLLVAKVEQERQSVLKIAVILSRSQLLLPLALEKRPVS